MPRDSMYDRVLTFCLCRAYDIGVAPHCPLSCIALAASLQLAFSTANFIICEMSAKMHYNSAEFDLLTFMKNPEVLAVKDGYVSLLTGPGLGIEINEELVRASAEEHKAFSWRNPVFRGPDGSVREW